MMRRAKESGDICARRASNRRGRAARMILACASLAVVGREALGQVFATWVSASSGTWTNASKWSSNPQFPNGPADTALIAAAGTNYTVTLNSNIAVASLTIDSSSATLNQTAGTLDVNMG